MSAEINTNELRSLLTKYYDDPTNVVVSIDYQAIIDFIKWIEEQE